MQSINHSINLKVKKRIKDIKGFYTHLFSTFLIIPFLIFINLKTVPQFHWFWFAIIAWCIGLTIHWINVYGLSNNNFKEKWKQNQLKELVGLNNQNETQYIQEQYFLIAKKQTKEIKGFYIHFFITLISSAIIIFINLQFMPSFHFFWFAVGGMFIAIFLHWFGVFGFDVFGMGKSWEENKIKELINKYK